LLGLPNACFFALPFTTVPFGRRMLPADIRLASPSLLAFGVLPAMQLPKALRFPAVALVPSPGRKDGVTAFSMTLPR
jgi:predicted outer membrane lipoprotein